MKKKTLLIGAAGAATVAALKGVPSYLDYRKNGIWREHHGIFAALVPTDLDLYRSLLREPLEMPEMAALGFYVVDYLQCISVKPYPEIFYQEATIALRCKHLGKEGWFIKTMPVAGQNIFAELTPMGGVFVGFPKYIADKINLEPLNGGWRGEVTHGGDTRLCLEWTRG